MSILISFLLSLALPAANPTTAGAYHPGHVKASLQVQHCPPAHRNAELRVMNILNSPLLPELRAQVDLGTASPRDVQLLTTARDRGTCDALWSALRASGTNLLPGDRVAFYRSGNMFFVPIFREQRNPPTRPGSVRLDGDSSLDVYDAQYRLVGRLAA